MLRLVSRFARRAAVGAALAIVLMLAPVPALGAVSDLLRVAVGTALLLVVLGKALYDTLYYDHYWP